MESESPRHATIQAEKLLAPSEATKTTGITAFLTSSCSKAFCLALFPQGFFLEANKLEGCAKMWRFDHPFVSICLMLLDVPCGLKPISANTFFAGPRLSANHNRQVMVSACFIIV